MSLNSFAEEALRQPSTVKYQCTNCHRLLPEDQFVTSNSDFLVSHRSPICNDCLEIYLTHYNFEWDAVDRICQFLNIPFIPKEYERVHKEYGDKVFPVYAKIFSQAEYEKLNWKQYYDTFKKLEAEGTINSELPLLEDKEIRRLQQKWGANYCEEELLYLEQLFNGLNKTQTINGFLQTDQAIKLCKLSLAIDSNIREGKDCDKLLSSYDKIVKAGDFTPQNTKNANDFESVGELVHWLEKRGFKNKFYTDATKDVVDETIKNIQSYNQRLYTNETGIGEDISRRIEALQSITTEDYYNLEQNYDMDEYEVDGFKLKTEDFQVNLDYDDEEELYGED